MCRLREFKGDCLYHKQCYVPQITLDTLVNAQKLSYIVYYYTLIAD